MWFTGPQVLPSAGKRVASWYASEQAWGVPAQGWVAEAQTERNADRVVDCRSQLLALVALGNHVIPLGWEDTQA